MDIYEKAEKLEGLIIGATAIPEGEGLEDGDLADALYTLSEAGLLGINDVNTALKIWRVVEYVRHNGMPEDCVL